MADFDRDDRPDLVVYRPSDSTWHALLSGSDYAYPQARVWQRGVSGDRPVQGDYDGDTWDDIATYRPSDSSWHIWGSQGGPDYGAAEQTYQRGVAGDRPAHGDYDGDDRDDIATYRTSDSSRHIWLSGRNYNTEQKYHRQIGRAEV